MTSVNFIASTLSFLLVSLNVIFICGQDDATALFQKCQKEANMTDDDLETFKNQQIPTTTSGKCLLACMFHASGLMIDSQYNLEGANALSEKVYKGNPKLLAKAKAMNEECAKELKTLDGDKCENAVMVANCTIRTSTKMEVQ